MIDILVLKNQQKIIISAIICVLFYLHGLSQVNADTSFFLENVGKSINTEYFELGPVVTPDGKGMYFTRNKNRNEYFKKGEGDDHDIWFSRVTNDNQWTKAKIMLFPKE